MGRRLRRGLALAALLTVAVTGTAEARQTVFGYNDREVFKERGQVTNLLRRTGAQTYRMALEWAGVEFQRGKWYWKTYDDRYKAIVDAGMEPVIILRSAPAWAQQPNLTACVVVFVVAGGCSRPPAPNHLGDWAEFARRVVKRYPKALGYEIFNEPNIASNWQPAANPEYYAQVLRVAHDAIKRAEPKAVVVSGGIAPLTPNGANMDADDFLRRFYAAGGRGAMDALGVHAYSFPVNPEIPASYYRQFMGSMRAIKAEYLDASTPIWITEFGYHVGSRALGGVDVHQQAEFIPKLIRMALKEPDVHVAMLHSLVDFGTDPDVLGDKFGLVDAGFGVRPALAEVERIVPPSLRVASTPASMRATCPKKRGKSVPCKKGMTPRIRVWKSGTTVTISITARKRRGFKLRRSLSVGDPHPVKISGRTKGKPLRPGRYTLAFKATDRFGNSSETVRRKLRIR